MTLMARSLNDDALTLLEVMSYEQFCERVRKSERAHPCRHGHCDCSDRDNGDCMDELYHNLSDAARALIG